MTLLEYRTPLTTDPSPTRTSFPYLPDLARVRGDTFAMLRIDPTFKLPSPYWFTREQLVALRDLLNTVLREWPLAETKPAERVGPPESTAASGADVVAR